MNFLKDLRDLPLGTLTLLCDSKSTIFMSQNLVAHKRAKHIDLDCHFVRELVSSDFARTWFVPSHCN